MKYSLTGFSATLAMLAMLATTAAQAQYPTKPVRIMVSISAGGAPDLAARAIAPGLGKAMGQPFIVENRPGANGNYAGLLTAQAPADGHTLLLAPDSLVVINSNLYKKLAFSPAKDLAPVSSIIRNQFVLAVSATLPVKTLGEFIAFARKANPPIAYASAGVGSQHHFLMEMLKARAGIDMLHVPYKGGSSAVAAVLAKQTMASFAGGASTVAHVRAGTLRVLASSGTSRALLMPNVPTVGETFPGYEGVVWSAVWIRSGTSEAIVSRLHDEINKILATREIKSLFNRSGGSEPFITTPDEFKAVIKRDTEKYIKVIDSLNLTADK